MKHHVEISNSTGNPTDTIIKVDGKQLRPEAISINISAWGHYDVTIKMSHVEIDFDGIVEDVVIE